MVCVDGAAIGQGDLISIKLLRQNVLLLCWYIEVAFDFQFVFQVKEFYENNAGVPGFISISNIQHNSSTGKVRNISNLELYFSIRANH